VVGGFSVMEKDFSLYWGLSIDAVAFGMASNTA